jgi:hypothetical protein
MVKGTISWKNLFIEKILLIPQRVKLASRADQAGSPSLQIMLFATSLGVDRALRLREDAPWRSFDRRQSHEPIS